MMRQGRNVAVLDNRSDSRFVRAVTERPGLACDGPRSPAPHFAPSPPFARDRCRRVVLGCGAGPWRMALAHSGERRRGASATQRAQRAGAPYSGADGGEPSGGGAGGKGDGGGAGGWGRRGGGGSPPTPPRGWRRHVPEKRREVGLPQQPPEAAAPPGWGPRLQAPPLVAARQVGAARAGAAPRLGAPDNGGMKREHAGVNFAKLETGSLRKYRRYYKLEVGPNASKDQLVHAVKAHFSGQTVDEGNVLTGFILALHGASHSHM
eukprot:CAMPEP_0114226732 /NCGR_PEP_ID=MMETSP0058-20121206/1395_1 /TAXON_ID=36894 /ORGANISM="Pyramimonas parkeae, CCMP726" /LENGTH=263 /DNA_ID=CAMNT_0001337489 /DNA_START=2492 /DNA_END=3283 /DNA_ORIENTATION=+